MTPQFKTLFLFAVLFVVSTFAASPCKPGYVEPEDCIFKAVDPEGGNCWWAADLGTCFNINVATTEAECADYCYLCLQCFYNYGCCSYGYPSYYPLCFNNCLAYLP